MPGDYKYPAQVWNFQEAPPELQKVCWCGGDEDLLILLPPGAWIPYRMEKWLYTELKDAVDKFHFSQTGFVERTRPGSSVPAVVSSYPPDYVGWTVLVVSFMEPGSEEAPA